jgi:hypothetical protein
MPDRVLSEDTTSDFTRKNKECPRIDTIDPGHIPIFFASNGLPDSAVYLINDTDTTTLGQIDKSGIPAAEITWRAFPGLTENGVF